MRRTPYIAPLFLAFMGTAAILNVTSHESFQAYRNVDVIGQLAAGMCFGAAMVLLMFFMRGGRVD
jgi:hypothetical protein